MESAKEAISKFTSRHGHTTEVDESVNRPVTSETVKPTRHENVTQAIDRETHQHHHHTTVQPLSHQEVLPEKHSHKQVPVEEREFHHGNESETRERLQQEAAKFQDTSRTHETQHTQASLPTAQGEHVHHHVHETVQPVIHKETVQPEVVHTTVPIHETHHADTQHHGTSVLPMKNLSEFGNPSQGTRHEEYDGVPRSYNKSMQQEQTDADLNPTKKGVDGPDSHHTGGTNLSAGEPFRDDGHMIQSGQGGSAGGYGTQGTPSSGYNSQNTGMTGQQSGMTGSSGLRSGEQGYGDNTSSGTGGKFGDFEGRDNQQGASSSHGTSGTATGTKPSLMDKLNPKVDSNGDGKAGFMK